MGAPHREESASTVWEKEAGGLQVRMPESNYSTSALSWIGCTGLPQQSAGFYISAGRERQHDLPLVSEQIGANHIRRAGLVGKTTTVHGKISAGPLREGRDVLVSMLTTAGQIKQDFTCHARLYTHLQYSAYAKYRHLWIASNSFPLSSSLRSAVSLCSFCSLPAHDSPRLEA